MHANDTPGPGLWEIHSGKIHRGEDGAEVTTTVRAKERKPIGTRLIGWASWLLAVLAGGVLAVSYAGQFVYIYDARHQVIAANIEAGMFDVGMIIFSLLALGLACAAKPARTERALILACAIGSAAMNYSAADVTSPRSVLVYVAPPLFLAVVVDRVVAVVRRYLLGADEGSPWAPLGRFALGVARLVGVTVLYSLRLVLDPAHTAKGLRRAVLNAAPLPAEPKIIPQVTFTPPNVTAGSKRAQLLTLYRQDPGYGDRAKVSKLAAELGPKVGLQPGSARTYLYAEVDARNAS